MPDYRRMARLIAREAGIDPNLFERQIDQESGFNPKARSGAGAQGIAQIVPKYHPGVDPFDPEASLTYAAKWMRQLLDQYKDPTLALVHYNGGGGGVQAWQSGKPYDESRQYVATIIGGPKTLAKPAEEGGMIPERPKELDAAEKLKGKAISIVPLDPKVKDEFGLEADNLSPTYRFMFGDGTYLDIKAVKPPDAPASSEQASAYVVMGGTALGSTSRAAEPKPGVIIGGQTPNEQFIVTQMPDGTTQQAPNPNYVAPRAATPAPGVVIGGQTPNEQFIVTQMPDGTTRQSPNPNYTAPKPDKPVTRTVTIGRTIYTLDDQGRVLNQIETPREPQEPRAPDLVAQSQATTRHLDAQTAGLERAAKPPSMLALQNHLDTIAQVEKMLAAGQIKTEKEAADFMAKSAAYMEASLRGSTPFEEDKERRVAEGERRRVGESILNQRLSSGSSLASSLLSSSAQMASKAFLPKGQSSFGVDPIAIALGLVNELGGGPEVKELARMLLGAASGGQGGMGAPPPMMAQPRPPTQFPNNPMTSFPGGY